MPTIESETALENDDNRRWERDYALRLRELELKGKEQRRWLPPLAVAIFAAGIGAAGNAVVTWVNGSLQRDLEDRKSQGELILESIKTGGDSEKASNNLRFLLKTELVTGESKKRLHIFMDTSQPNERPSLGGGGGCADILQQGLRMRADRNVMTHDTLPKLDDLISALTPEFKLAYESCVFTMSLQR